MLGVDLKDWGSACEQLNSLMLSHGFPPPPWISDFGVETGTASVIGGLFKVLVPQS